MTDTPRKGGRFVKGHAYNPSGRPKKRRTVDGEILKAAYEPVTVTENGRRKRISKTAANAKKLVNSGVTGTSREARSALEMAQRAEERAAANAPSSETLSAVDEAILDRFVERLKHIWQEEQDHDSSET
jgi:hypothetical protein